MFCDFIITYKLAYRIDKMSRLCYWNNENIVKTSFVLTNNFIKTLRFEI